MPLKVNVIFFGEARDLAGMKAVEVEMTVDTCKMPDLLHTLNHVAGKQLSGKLLVIGARGVVSLGPGYKFMINKRIMNSQEAFDVVLRDADEVGILPPFSGG
jgi:molybdopterin converting factor small subunit